MAETMEAQVEDEVVEDQTQDEADTDLEEPAEEATETEQEPEAPSLDAETLALARDVGLSDADLKVLGSKEAVWAAVKTATNMAQQMIHSQGGEQQPALSEAQTSESESPVFGELDLSDLDDDDPIRAKLTQLHTDAKKAMEAQRKEVALLKQQLSGFQQGQQNQELVRQSQEFDGIIRELNPERFGEGDIQEVNSAFQAERQRVWGDFLRLREALPQRSTAELVQMAAGVNGSSPSNTAPKVRPKSKRPSQIQGGQPGTPSKADTQAKIDALNERLNKRLATGDFN